MFLNHRLLRDPGAGGGGGGAATDLAKIVIEGDAAKGISNWTEVFPAEMRNVKDGDKEVLNPILAKYKTPSELLKGVSEMNDLIGRKGVILPKEGDAKDLDRFYTDLGRPAKPEEYKFTELKDLHPAVKVTPESLAGWARVAHGFGMPQALADNLNQWYLKVMDATVKDAEAKAIKARQDGETKLRADWKENYDGNFKAAQLAMKTFGGANILNKLGNLGSDPEVMAMFYNIGKKISPDGTFIPGGGGGQGGADMNKEQAQTRLTEINNMVTDPKSPLMDENHKDHDAIVKERTKMYEIINLPSAQ